MPGNAPAPGTAAAGTAAAGTTAPRVVVPRAVVPAYIHPAADPEAWSLLHRHAALVRLVVVNVADGPGDRPDPAYRDVVAPLGRSPAAVGGYVDTNYGQRGLDEVLAEIGRYLDWYGIAAVFLDRVGSGADQLDYYEPLTVRARALGVRLIAFNHGTHPDPGYADHGDLLGTFEGPWRAYAEADVPGWVRGLPAERLFHLVYSVPRAGHADAYALARARGAGGVFVTDHGGANPWDYLPADLFTHLVRRPPRPRW